MSLDIVVKRDPCGPYKYTDVSEPLLGTSVEAAISLGESILDEYGTGSQSVEYVIAYRAGLKCGLLVKVFDTLSLEWIYGKIVAVEHNVSREGDNSIVLRSTIKLLRPTPFFSIST